MERLSVKDTIDAIDRKSFLLPALQRSFVWKPDQVRKLFDSLMKDYPIGSFLFWKVEGKNIREYQFYEFICKYHEGKNTRNPDANVSLKQEVTVILDGQQRLTSLYMGLMGYYAYRLPRQRSDKPEAYPERKLYLNLVAPAPSENADLQQYDFQFLTEEESENSDSGHHWFEVGRILNMAEPVSVSDYLGEKDIPALGREVHRFASGALLKLREVIHISKPIGYFPVSPASSLEKVLDIFIRVNSGGTKLEHSDILFSMATVRWRDRDARKTIADFVEEINKVGDGFNADKDFVLKSCLVLCGSPNIAFKVDNFRKSNMIEIEQKWDAISKAIKASFVLLASLGYHRDRLTAYNAIIPIATYLHKIGTPDTFAESSRYGEDRKKISKWLAMVLLKRTFGGHSDNVLIAIRDVITTDSGNEFPFDAMVHRLKGGPKDMSFNDDEIHSLLGGQSRAADKYFVLTLLYPSLDLLKNKFHIDHIFPKKLLTRKILQALGIAEAERDCLANLQLLEGTLNLEKSGKDPNEWLDIICPNENARTAYKKTHDIPDVDLSLGNFREFIKQREQLLFSKLKELLA
ncbi:MAG: DUF262 domain-containing protein [Nitrospira sp.]|nr:DUF262 domain-containing protein [Nitrospira sp.]